MRKTTIKIRANIAERVDACKAARLVINNWHNETTNIVNSNREVEIVPTNVELAEYGVHIKTFFADSICETCCK